jgi:hypothetical protein
VNVGSPGKHSRLLKKIMKGKISWTDSGVV